MKPDRYPDVAWTDAMIDALAYAVGALCMFMGGVSYAWRGWSGVLVSTAGLTFLAVRQHRRAFPRSRSTS